MPKFEALIVGLPPEWGGRLTDLRNQVREAVKPYQRKMRSETGESVEQTVYPRFETHVQWLGENAIVVILEQWKPEYSKDVVMDFSADEYDALKERVGQQGVSWEAFFRQVVENG